MEILGYIALNIIASFLVAALAPKPPKPKPAALADFEVPTAEEGRELPMHFGSPWVSGPNVIWYGDLRSKAIKKKSGGLF